MKNQTATDENSAARWWQILCEVEGIRPFPTPREAYLAHMATEHGTPDD